MRNKIRTAELFDCRIPYLTPMFDSSEYPWEILPRIKEYINQIIKQGLKGYTLMSEGILVGEHVKIHPTAVINPPVILGDYTEIRPGAFIRGCVITGERCVIGNSTELKNCILLNDVQVPHYNYVGDSILGNKAHMGAGAICSNLKSDRKTVVIHGDREYSTGLRKVGGILADGTDIGCGCVINPGTIIGKGTSVYPLTSVRGVIDENCIVKSTTNIVNKTEKENV